MQCPRHSLAVRNAGNRDVLVGVRRAYSHHGIIEQPLARDTSLNAAPPRERVARRKGRVVVHAYILIQTEVGKAPAVVAAVGEIEGVLVAHDVTGPYDAIVQVEAETIDDLGRLVVSSVQTVPGITRTLTCPVVNL